MIDRDYLESVSIDRLAPAARAAGLAFKNGTLNKAALIDRLCAYPSIGAACVAVLKRQDLRGRAKPAIPASDWLDGENSPEASSELQAETAPSTPARNAPIDLSPYALKSEVSALSDAFGGRISAQAQALADHAQWATRENHALRLEVESLRANAPKLIQIGEAPLVRIEGRTHQQFPDLLAWLSAIGRVILSGPAGTGKSRAARQAAQALGLDFHIQTPVTMAHELIGHRDAQGQFHETPLTRAYKNGGLCLCDEFDSCAPDALLVANPIFDGNGFAMLGDGQLHEQHPDFRVILNMNTQGDGANLKYTGRNPLDGATLARFGGMLHWGIDSRLEQSMASGNDQWLAVIREVRALVEARGIETVTATTRHTMIGARLLANSFFADKRAFVLESSLKNGALVEIWSDVLRLPAVRAFLQA